MLMTTARMLATRNVRRSGFGLKLQANFVYIPYNYKECEGGYMQMQPLALAKAEAWRDQAQMEQKPGTGVFSDELS